jgi:CelD/BcsL family acetyltransferase involved in cellulose biosynthesis
MLLEESALQERHGVKPAHSGAEMTLLGERFPKNVRLFVASRADELLGGVLVFDCGPTVHAQYIAASPEGREASATDAVVYQLITQTFADRTYFDFGISTENAGRVLNEGLAAFKESFGARSVVYEHYRLML